MVRCPSHVELEAFAAGTGGNDLEQRVALHVEECPTCSARLSRASGEESLVAELRAALDEPIEQAPGAPTSFAHYRVLGPLGEGGMGVVFEAEQQRPRRRVALKVLRPGAVGARALRRFEYEAEVLGRLDHPGIARIHEAGTFESDSAPRPFLAMERVEGRPLDEHVRTENPDRGARLGLFLAVCDAVQHAHRRGVLHRDLKPSNVLVTPEGRPKILDFGIARPLEADRSASLATRPGQLVGTPAYMSPEQVSDDPASLDTRTDVYSLGVVLYELLAGRPPLALDGVSLPEIARRVVEEEPPPLGALDRSLAGDLETIVAKALEKDRERRYAAVSDLAGDVRRFLADEPITARPPTMRYRLSKFVRRNRALSVAGLTAVVALMVGLVGIALQSEATRRQRDRADSIRVFLEDLLRAANPVHAAHASDYTVRQALDEATLRLESGLRGEPVVEASLRTTIGEAYVHLGAYDAAERHLRRALDLRRRRFGDEHVSVAATLAALAEVLRSRGWTDAAEELASRAHALYEAGAVEDDGLVQAKSVLADIAGHHRLDYAAAERLLREAVAIQERVHGKNHALLPVTLSKLAGVYERRRNMVEAEATYRRALELSRAVNGRAHVHTFSCGEQLGSFLREKGALAEAEELAREALQAFEEVLGPDHPLVGPRLLNLAAVVRQRGDHARAEELDRRGLDLLDDRYVGHRVLREETALRLSSPPGARDDEQRREDYATLLERLAVELGPAHPDLDDTRRSLAESLIAAGEEDAVERLYRDALRATEGVPGAEQRRTAFRNNIAASLVRRGRHAEAVAQFRAVLDERIALLGEDHSLVGNAHNNLSVALLRSGAHLEAEEHARRAVAIYENVLGEPHVRTAKAHKTLGNALVEQRRLQEAEPYLRRSVAWFDERPPDLPPMSRALRWTHGESLYYLGRCLLLQGRGTEAAGFLERAVAQLEGRMVQGLPDAGTASRLLEDARSR